ncbi:DUF2218 domain-containing protein [Acinetobacter pragensis]|uniref:DUF2218 domain-containing protein n=1 Tax=Acinetobacter pragensis TaxID=1806892 RepID=UPI00333E67E1
MPKTTRATIATVQAGRIAKRLLNHWKHKFEVADSEQLLQIVMPSATVQLMPLAESLAVEITATQEDTDLPRLEQVVLDHLIRMGQEELTAVWQRSE